MDKYLLDFYSIIQNCRVDNTYKMAWAKAILELSSNSSSPQTIQLEQIALKMFKYYWNQTIYFNLVQGSNLDKRPEFLTEVRKTIEAYYNKTQKRKPIHYERVSHKLQINTPKLVSILKANVSWRFQKLKGDTKLIYKYQKGSNTIELLNPKILSDFSELLYDAINFRWTQILEKFNLSPNVAKKVRVLDFGEIKRNSLSKFKPYLDKENPSCSCFICGKTIDSESLSIDHVIPWSFMFSDDLWNLVYVHKSCNSRKSNIIPSKIEISKLEQRNKKLLSILEQSEFNSTTETKRLESAINYNYVQKFWINCKN